MLAQRLVVRALFLLVLAAAAAGCARAVSVGSDARPVYRVNIHNETGEAMIVSYDEGRGTALLGTVPAGRADSFVIAARSTTVTITARNVPGTRVLSPITVHLSETAAQTVRLR